ncbi:intracellular protein transport protein USO1 [Reticulomyxa filosa]|uniref:Intracellular protein transport protein USO1 n=1 Tax=Reticulomyxa filosa TaxID=46433 RepID=X6N4Z4_RETFI|nr:intracellular protein transport protein USO1 [Reticulomyxa filosa]|eukprot:ETO20362.1 intracellular protein transport protein USO1 [Reticulomyxa filosa]
MRKITAMQQVLCVVLSGFARIRDCRFYERWSVAKSEECIFVTQQMEKCHQEIKKRIQVLSEAMTGLHSSLEVFDSAYSAMGSGREAGQLKRELEEAKKLMQEKDSTLARMKVGHEEKIKKLEEKERQLEEKEKGLDEEVNDIAKQVFF